VDDAQFCKNCGGDIATTEIKAESCDGQRNYDDQERYYHINFFWRGLWSVAAGIFIVFVGLGAVFGISFWTWFLSALLITAGLGIIISALWRSKKRRQY
jgi:uncharacterized membrane-anchored protein